MNQEPENKKIVMNSTELGVHYGLLDHVVKFESCRRVCVHCGKQLKKNQRAFGIITNCPQTLPHDTTPGNFFIHAKCAGTTHENIIDKDKLNIIIDEVIQEYQTVNTFVNKYGSKWGLKIFMYGND